MKDTRVSKAKIAQTSSVYIKALNSSTDIFSLQDELLLLAVLV